MQKLRKILFSILILSLFTVAAGFSAAVIQINNPLPVKKDSSLKQPKTIDSTDTKFTFSPALGVGIGMLSYIGGVEVNGGTTNFQSPSSGRIGYSIGLSQKLFPSLECSLNFLYGTVAANERTTDVYWNFQSKIAGGGIGFLYKILPKQELSPYITIGAEAYNFNSTADIYTSNGSPYYNWSDGTLRSLPQSSPNAASAKILSLSYGYLTNVSSGTAENTFAIPLGIGFMFRLSQRANFMIGSTLHYTFTNHMDGYVTPGTPPNDMFLFTYISLRFNLIGHSKKEAPDDDIANTPVTHIIKDTLHTYKHTDTVSQHSIAGGETATAGNSDTIHYTIQLISTKNKLKEGLHFAGIDNKASETIENGEYVYTMGNYTNISDAVNFLKQVKGMGYVDAFIKGTKNGKQMEVSMPQGINNSPDVIPTTDVSKSKKGLVFKIQYGVFDETPNKSFILMFHKLKNTIVMKDAAGLNHYMTASYNTFKAAQTARDKIKESGVDVCVKAVYKGQFISISDAIDLLK